MNYANYIDHTLLKADATEKDIKKLCKEAKEYDENTVYYIAAEEITSSYEKLDGAKQMLYKLDVETNQVEKILDLEEQPAEETGMSGFAISMIVMAI